MNAKKNRAVERELRDLLITLKLDIGDDCRAEGCEDSTTPSMTVTIGGTVEGGVITDWNYQTGDNSFTGAAYGFPHWAVITLHRRSNSTELAREAVDEILSLASQ